MEIGSTKYDSLKKDVTIFETCPTKLTGKSEPITPK